MTSKLPDLPRGPTRPAGAWLACYDIAEPRRLGRVWRAVREFGVPLQYSVFWARLDGAGLKAALESVASRIDPRADDVRFYPLPENAEITGLGRDVLPLGVDLGDPVLRRFRHPAAEKQAPPRCRRRPVKWTMLSPSGTMTCGRTQLAAVRRCLTSVSRSPWDGSRIRRERLDFCPETKGIETPSRDLISRSSIC